MAERRRLLSLDLLRGIVVLLMLFVNQVDSVEDAPAFLRHAPSGADTLTLADAILPAFLFMLGVSIPLALGRRRRSSPMAALRHVLARGAALLFIGVLIVDAEVASPAAVLSPPVWGALAMVGALLAWQVPAAPGAPRWRRWLRPAGAALLVLLVLVYRMDGGSGFLQLRPHWWGILGAIGWAYLVAASLYLLLGDRPVLLLAGVAALQGLYFLDQLGRPGFILALRPWLGVGGLLGTHGGIALAGSVLGVAIAGRSQEPGAVLPLAIRGLALAFGLVATGLWLHGFGDHAAFAFSKELATPAWGLVSAGLTALVWVVVFLAADGAGWRRWPRVVREAGENALLTYLLEPLVLALLAASAALFGRNPWSLLAGGTTAGLASGALFAWLVGRLAGLLAGAGFRLRL